MKTMKIGQGRFIAGVFACIAILGTPATLAAQTQLTPVITVNDSAVTQYEFTQRIRLLQAFRTAGDVAAAARNELIEDRLKQQELARYGLSLTQAQLQTALDDFAGRANLPLAEFLQVLASEGVDAQALSDYVGVRVLWRDYIRARFNREVTVTDADVERALGQTGSSPTELQVLLTEIIIAAPPERAALARDVAGQISRLRSYAEFEDAARQVSALPSRENGGRLGWLPLDNYPPQLRDVLLDLAPGQITEPIEIPNGIALFQKRGQREAPRATAAPVSIEYASYYIAGGRSDAALARAAQVRDSVDTCDDLYGIARDQDPAVLDRVTVEPSAIAGDVAIELARLDAGEVSYNLTRDNGETLVFLMLCARNGAGVDTANPDTVRNQIRSQRLTALADALVADLRASALIRP